MTSEWGSRCGNMGVNSGILMMKVVVIEKT